MHVYYVIINQEKLIKKLVPFTISVCLIRSASFYLKFVFCFICTHALYVISVHLYRQTLLYSSKYRFLIDLLLLTYATASPFNRHNCPPKRHIWFYRTDNIFASMLYYTNTHVLFISKSCNSLLGHLCWRGQ